MRNLRFARAERSDCDRRDDKFDLEALLHPARVFAHPAEVVHDPDLSLDEKRAILASWASDACAVEAAPALRARPGAAKPVAFDDVMDALRTLDGTRADARAGDRRERQDRARSIAAKSKRGSGRHGLDASGA